MKYLPSFDTDGLDIEILSPIEAVCLLVDLLALEKVTTWDQK